jgi:P27 family predicted phage terminase small subunit
MRVLTEADYLALGNLCWAFQTATQAQRELAKAGLLYKTKSGYIQPSPYMSIILQNMALVNKLLSEFGMVPGSRSRLSAAPPEAPPSKWDL